MAESALAGLAFGGVEPPKEPTERQEPQVEGSEEVVEAVEEPVVDAAAVRAKEREARVKGWRPRNEFKGNPDDWVDAQEYLDRAQQVMPLLKSENRRLTGQLNEQGGLITTLQRRLDDQAKELEALRKSSSQQTRDQRREQITDLIMQAREAGDVRTEVQLNAKLAALEAQPDPEPTSTSRTTEPPADDPNKGRLSPEFRQWAEENPWWTEDPVKRATATAIAQKLAQDGSLEGMTPRERLEYIAEETEKYLGQRTSGGAPKVNGTRPTGQGGGGAPRGSSSKSWDALPANVKAQAMRQASKFKLVGPGKSFKNMKEWQDFYAKDYNSGGVPVQLVEIGGEA